MAFSIFRYPGGKSKASIQKQILANMPKNFDSFREPFCGGASVFFSIPTHIKRWINDKDPNLMFVYHALRYYPDEFIKKCREIEPAKNGEELVSAREGGRALYNARLKGWFDYFANNKECDQALRYLFINRTNFSGRVRYDLPSRLYFSNPSGWNLVKTNKLEKAAQILQNVSMSNSDYKELLRFDGDNVFIYIDPPYVVNTKLANSSRLYAHNFEMEDHELLAQNCRKCKHKIMLSYDDDPLIRSLYSDWNIVELNWKYCGTSSAQNLSDDAKKKKLGKELLIKNY